MASAAWWGRPAAGGSYRPANNNTWQRSVCQICSPQNREKHFAFVRCSYRSHVRIEGMFIGAEPEESLLMYMWPWAAFSPLGWTFLLWHKLHNCRMIADMYRKLFRNHLLLFSSTKLQMLWGWNTATTGTNKRWYVDGSRSPQFICF